MDLEEAASCAAEKPMDVVSGRTLPSLRSGEEFNGIVGFHDLVGQS
jgi:hypothetical protein